MTLSYTAISPRPDMLGESPVWDAASGTLYWVDGVSRLVRSHRPEAGVFHEWPMPSMAGSLALAGAGCLVVGLADGVYVFDLVSATLTPLFRPSPIEPDIRFNDGKVDRQGRFLIGTMSIHAEPRGKLFRIGPGGGAQTLLEGVRISNSLAFSPGGDVMYFSDSRERAIRAYTYVGAGGELGEQMLLIDTKEFDSGPDGATVDHEGNLWVALVHAGKIACFSPEGSLLRLIDAPTDKPSSLAFGGPGLETLYVTSIKDSGTGRAVSSHPQGGTLFAIEGLGTHGIAEVGFEVGWQETVIPGEGERS